MLHRLDEYWLSVGHTDSLSLVQAAVQILPVSDLPRNQISVC